MRFRRLYFSIFLLALSATGFRAAAADNLDPETERQSFKIADGWEINLFAADPMFEKPIQINWDNRGRLWVATSRTYPQIKPGEIPNDKIVILEDTLGQGKADKAIVFADGLFMPTAVVPGDGGAYATNSTEILHFDENPVTGKAEHRRVVLAGFGTEDTHQFIHTLHWGFDGRLYWNQSLYIHSNIETPRGVVTLLGSGVWRFDPRTADLDIFTRGLINPWGTVFDRWGRWFQTDGAGFGGMSYAFPGAAFESAMGVEKLMPGLNLKSPKYVSEELLSGRHIPDDYQGDILTNDFRAHRMVRFKLHPDGSGFSSQQMPDFLTSTDPAFRPVDIRMGPDGAIYIADWYNPIIQHGEVDFRDPRRDHLHGRIWRVTAKGRRLVDRPVIAGAPIPALLELLKSPEDYTRLHTKLELRERESEEVAPALATWIKALKPEASDFEHNKLEALWVYETINTPEAPLLQQLLTAHDAHARAAAVRVASRWTAQLPNAREIFAAAVADGDPAVRLEGILALQTLDTSEAVEIAMRALDQPRDQFIDFALWSIATNLKDLWLPDFQAGRLTKWDKPEHMIFALEAVKSPVAIASLLSQLKSNQIPASSRGGVIDLIASIDSKGQADTLFDLAVGSDITDTDTRLLLLNALQHIARSDGAQPQRNPDRIGGIADASAEPLRCDALHLIGLWKLETLRPRLTSIASDKSASLSLRSAAFEGLAGLGGGASKTLLESFTDDNSEPAVRSAAVSALVSLDLPAASKGGAKLLASNLADTSINALLISFVQHENGADALAKAMGAQTVPPATARAALQCLQANSAGDSSLAHLFEKAAGASSGPTRLSPDQMRQTIADVLAQGDAKRGELIFRRHEIGCYQCHAINGVGGFLAPDLGSIGASSPMDYVIDSILDPNKAIKDGYMGVAVVTREGDVISAIKVRQDSQNIVLRDALHEEIVIPLKNVRRQKDVGSLMPTGLTDPLFHAEFLDLVRFVSELGKPGPFAQSSPRVARRWRVLTATPPDAGADSATLPPWISSDKNWLPAYGLLNGDLPMDALPRSDAGAFAVVQCDFNVIVEGKLALHLGATGQLAGWVDQAGLTIGKDIPLELSRGPHTLTFRINLRDRGNLPLRAELSAAGDSSARAEFLGGK
jgi:putative heme-binding domain-containing protein